MRGIGIVDIGVAAVLFVAIVLPPRQMYAASAFKGDDTATFALATAEARTMAHPTDGAARADLARRLGDVKLNDWAIEDAVRGSELAKDSPTRWRALLAASVAYVDRLDPVNALKYANQALAACESSQEIGGGDACPSWEQIRMSLYQEHLDAGVKSHIDPKTNPTGFRKAGEKGIRAIHLNGNHDPVDPVPPQPPKSKATP